MDDIDNDMDLVSEGEMDNGPEEKPTRVTVHKIDNGFVIEAYGPTGEQAEFIKNISKAPSVISRMFGVTKETRDAISKGTKIESTQKGTKLQVKITR